ncbi:MAG TPA: L-seryl-tRNA(Sec) selenium transferase [Bacteroidetes bacterium]|nr:L-seryl-tRNA(Sec) selenium transferase [Bacteroidota bacterium]
MNKKNEILKNLPSVNKILKNQTVKELVLLFGRETVLYAIRQTLEFFRDKTINLGISFSDEEIIQKVVEVNNLFTKKSLRRVINATGIVIHTNLGRSPLGSNLLDETFEILTDYNNLEFDLQTGKRGSRLVHTSSILKLLTGADDVIVVNNAAAAVMLCLNTFAKKKEVIVSRGELVEIGGSFRVPEIMKAAGCKMVEVGTTNKTKSADYENAITSKTALLFKAHKSNYVINGFTEEVDLQELCNIGRKHQIPVIYDQGSGLLKNMNLQIFENEPNIKKSISTGVDLVCFSGDKLLGGPQAGIIAGKKEYIDKLKKNPMLRALRVCKVTIALLETVCSYYLKDEILFSKNKIYKSISKDISELDIRAKRLANLLQTNGINCEVVETKPQIGGGTLPDKTIHSRAVLLISDISSNKLRSEYAEKIYKILLNSTIPVLGILVKGNLLLDVMTINEDDIEFVANAIVDAHKIM